MARKEVPIIIVTTIVQTITTTIDVKREKEILGTCKEREDRENHNFNLKKKYKISTAIRILRKFDKVTLFL